MFNNIQKMCSEKFHWSSNHAYRQLTFIVTSLKTEKRCPLTSVVKLIISEITLIQDKIQFTIDDIFKIANIIM